MDPPPHDPEMEVLSAGRPPRDPYPRGVRLAATLCLACLVAAAAAVGYAVHYHGQVARARVRLAASPVLPAVRVPRPPSASAPRLVTVSRLLRAGGSLAVRVIVTAAEQQTVTGPYGGLLVTGRLTGGRPGTRYRLVGLDCSTTGYADPTVLASGQANRMGQAVLVGPSAPTMLNAFWALQLQPLRGPNQGHGSANGLQGFLDRGQIAIVPSGDALCIPVGGR